MLDVDAIIAWYHAFVMLPLSLILPLFSYAFCCSYLLLFIDIRHADSFAADADSFHFLISLILPLFLVIRFHYFLLIYYCYAYAAALISPSPQAAMPPCQRVLLLIFRRSCLARWWCQARCCAAEPPCMLMRHAAAGYAVLARDATQRQSRRRWASAFYAACRHYAYVAGALRDDAVAERQRTCRLMLLMLISFFFHAVDFSLFSMIFSFDYGFRSAFCCCFHFLRHCILSPCLL